MLFLWHFRQASEEVSLVESGFCFPEGATTSGLVRAAGASNWTTRRIGLVVSLLVMVVR